MAEDMPGQPLDQPLSQPLAERFARLALDCVHREYPNKIAHVFQSDEDAKTPRELYPVFYGCFDWHSSVHGHWLLTRVLRTYPETELRDEIIAALDESFTTENIAGEVAYFAGEGRASFERPYGLAWFLQLMTELREWDDPQAQEWAGTLAPLEEAVVTRITDWLPKLAYPIRLGTHNQSAFAFGLYLDWADATGNDDVASLVRRKAMEFHEKDVNCPLAFEPSGEDFLSPCLMEADLMRRVIEGEAYARWLGTFLPQIPIDGSGDWLAPGIVLDPADGKLVHLDGVNLSRAWALEGIASSLPEGDVRIPALLAAAEIHREAGIASVSAEHYEGSHWLASFATYLVTRRGIKGD
ncbi:DUF2891 family protein [Parvularcula flava]|nr:DUF2891 family protein [Aquisalinus luteolus]